MTIGFEVVGPCTIQTDAVLDGTLVDLGYTDNDDLPSYDEEIFNRPLTSTRWADTVVDMVYRGKAALLSVVLVEWENLELIDLLDKMPGAAGAGATGESDLGQPGTRWRPGSPETDHTRQIKIKPIIVGQFEYLFHNCILNGAGGYRVFDLGNQEKRIGLQFIVLPELVLNLVSTASAFYTRTAI